MAFNVLSCNWLFVRETSEPAFGFRRCGDAARDGTRRDGRQIDSHEGAQKNRPRQSEALAPTAHSTPSACPHDSTRLGDDVMGVSLAAPIGAGSPRKGSGTVAHVEVGSARCTRASPLNEERLAGQTLSVSSCGRTSGAERVTCRQSRPSGTSRYAVFTRAGDRLAIFIRRRQHGRRAT